MRMSCIPRSERLANGKDVERAGGAVLDAGGTRAQADGVSTSQQSSVVSPQ